jgi:hypothetical protein
LQKTGAKNFEKMVILIIEAPLHHNQKICFIGQNQFKFQLRTMAIA